MFSQGDRRLISTGFSPWSSSVLGFTSLVPLIGRKGGSGRPGSLTENNQFKLLPKGVSCLGLPAFCLCLSSGHTMAICRGAPQPSQGPCALHTGSSVVPSSRTCVNHPRTCCLQILPRGTLPTAFLIYNPFIRCLNKNVQLLWQKVLSLWWH